MFLLGESPSQNELLSALLLLQLPQTFRQWPGQKIHAFGSIHQRVELSICPDRGAGVLIGTNVSVHHATRSSRASIPRLRNRTWTASRETTNLSAISRSSMPISAQAWTTSFGINREAPNSAA